MRIDQFRIWMRFTPKRNLGRKTICNAVAQISRVCLNLGDLDLVPAAERPAFKDRFNYGRPGERRVDPSPVDIPIAGNLREGLDDLKKAVKLYFEFLESWPDETAPPDYIADVDLDYEENPKRLRRPRRNGRRAAAVGPFPQWDSIHDDPPRALSLVQAELFRSVYFLKPKCIEALVAQNMVAEYQQNVIARVQELTEGEGLGARARIQMESYVWERCATCFPGIRRYIGKHERPGQTDKPNSIRLDSNQFPKEIWAYCLTGGPFQNQGPVDFQLDHLLEHKRSLHEHGFLLPPQPVDPRIYVGLFTSAANTVYTDRALSSFTNHCPLAVEVLARIAHRLYGQTCEILPPGWAFGPAAGEVETAVNAFFESPNFADHLVGDPIHIPAFAQRRLEKYAEDLLAGI